jgi:hypothetical protein
VALASVQTIGDAETPAAHNTVSAPRRS